METVNSSNPSPLGWQSGDEIVITCPLAIHRGKRARLEERHLGRISGRPYWTLQLTASGAMTSEFEDSL